ncbi:MAG: VCBS repeat-containing protein [Acidobacteriota bacterium]
MPSGLRIGPLSALLLLASALSAEAGLPSTPRVKYTVDFGDAGTPTTSPLVVSLDADGCPDIVLLREGGVSGSELVILDGPTGRVLGVNVVPSDPHALAVGDLEGDGDLELLTTRSTGVQVHDISGLLIDELPWAGLPPSHRPGLGLADLDQDGSTEIFLSHLVVSSGVSPAWSARPAPESRYVSSHAVDLDPTSPGLELLFGRSCHAADGTLLWEAGEPLGDPSLPNGMTAVGDLDGDGDPEVVLVSPADATGEGGLHVLAHDGRWLNTWPLAPDQPPSPPLVVDVDGDTLAEILVTTPERIGLFDWSGDALALRWTEDEESSCCGGLSAFDFDGDGALEIVHRKDDGWTLREGSTGDLLHEEPFPSFTAHERPIIADVDGDGSAEILISRAYLPADGPDLIVYDVDGATGARSIWNQESYHVTNVNDDGSIPAVEAPPWLETSGWGAQATSIASRCGQLVGSETVELRTCLGETVTLDGSAVTIAGCAGTLTRAWFEDDVEIGTDPMLVVDVDGPRELHLRVACDGVTCCDSKRFTIDVGPSFAGELGATERGCDPGVDLAWDPVGSGAGDGAYHLYRAAGDLATPADALAAPPIAIDFGGLWYFDPDPPAGRLVYVVAYEEPVTPSSPACPTGPLFGGRFATLDTSVENEEWPIPEGVGAVLRVRWQDRASFLSWPTARPLLPDERYLLLKSTSPTTGWFELRSTTTRTYRDDRPDGIMEFFDLRVENPCDQISEDEFPPGP